jgi:hypothetical protein
MWGCEDVEITFSHRILISTFSHLLHIPFNTPLFVFHMHGPPIAALRADTFDRTRAPYVHSIL